MDPTPQNGTMHDDGTNRMFDVNVFLSHCPWIQDIDNGTELAIAWVTQGRTVLNQTPPQLDVEVITDELRELRTTLSADVRGSQSAVERRMEEQLRPLHEALTTKQSTARGKLGEALYDQWITPCIQGSWETTCSKTIPHSGDYIHTHYDSKKRVMTDVKQYASTVGRKEIDKLWNDMLQQEIPLGLIVSMSSKIAGRRELDIEYQLHGNKRYCMMSVSNAMDRKEILGLALELLRNQETDTSAREKDLRPLQEVLETIRALEATAIEFEKRQMQSVSENRTKVRNQCETMKRILAMLCENS